ncbi:arginine N-succinyltransferase [Larsenimonas suaedae]|uniref:Arginine N-succinyltransferase n=1 Tax=Larsenimonas suaedae TaxID=1851019 RepID=A0ABU1GV47_9GAMM|nr:arginine N-succinyltransferase [Larsenimonas suaedae]MCM2971201.1 arginine N-succinyltransferase [Larsenimonas suaedae]MDR5895910.1 arginine N-succinyltransferase [Larsenimonas suaedae]
MPVVRTATFDDRPRLDALRSRLHPWWPQDTLDDALCQLADPCADARETPKSGHAVILMIENTHGDIVAFAALALGAVEGTPPFFSFHRDRITSHSHALDVHRPLETLGITNALTHHIRLGPIGLFDTADVETTQLLAAGCLGYLLTANHARAPVLCELPGTSDAHGESPFWHGVGGRFFGVSHARAEALWQARQRDFLADMLPLYPLYVPLLPETTQAALGVEHETLTPWRHALEALGFVESEYLDIFHGGPTLIATADHLSARTRRTQATTSPPPGSLWVRPPSATTPFEAGLLDTDQDTAFEPDALIQYFEAPYPTSASSAGDCR